jgi:hypothetical protein
MPPLPDAAAIVRVRVAGTVNSSPFNNLFHLQYSGAAPTVAQLNALCTSVLTAWQTNFKALCPSSVVLAGADAQDLTNASAATGAATDTTAGTRAGTAMPNSIAACITWKINNRYRGGHPRTYLPAGVVADVSGGNRWTDAFVTAADSAAAAFLTAMNAITEGGATYKMVCLSYVRSKVKLAVPVPYTIQSSLVDHRPDTQRRRLGKDISA